MKRITSFLFACTLTFAICSAAIDDNTPRFASNAALDPAGQLVVFSFEGDLWRVPANGGTAYRLTALPGEEINPRISPDGKWLAFSSNQYGNQDIFIMPLDGGEIRQLTYHDANDEVDGWSWDSQTIYFTSGRYNRFGSYAVGIDGGTARQLFPHYFNTTHHIVEMPDGSLLFNDTWESYSAAARKRYKGAFNPDILSYHPETKAFSRLTDYEGKDFWASADRNGNIFFVSDEANGEYNLYTFVKGNKTALTTFETSIKRPFVSANGQKVVFEKDYQLHVYDVSTKASTPIPITLNRNASLDKMQEFDVKGNISHFDVSEDGKKMAFISRGELFVSDIEGKFIRQIPLAGERVSEVKWMADNKTLLFNQTLQGYLNWYSVVADGKSEVKQLTQDTRSNRDIALNADRTQAVYLSGRDEVRLLDLKTMQSKTIVHDELWAFQNSAPSFSPNGEYVLFTAYRNFEQDIFIHHIQKGITINLTNTGVSETSPSWSPDGKYIYFVSNRTRPSYPFGMQNASVFRMALDNYDEPYRTEKFDALFEEKKDDSTAKTDTAASASKDDTIVISIEADGISDRIVRISPAFGSQAGTDVLKKGEKTYVFYRSNHEGGRYALYRTVIEPFEDNRTEKVADGNVSMLVRADNKFFLLSGGNVSKYNIDANKVEGISIDHKFMRNLESEFSQMFYETWAGIEENFYDEDFHGLDWVKMRDRYATYLPYLNNRNDLRILLNDLLGELNSSHLGFSSSGPEERKHLRYVTNETGIIFNQENPYEVARIAKKSNATRKEVDIQPGDVLVAVDGKKVDRAHDRDDYFTRPSLASELVLTLNRNGREVRTTVRPQSTGSLRDNLYDEWISDNRSRVDSLSGNRIAYSHMKNMSDGELERFLLDMVAYENKKEALILDLRYNTGGNVHDEVLKFLSQRPYLQWKYRGGQLTNQGNFGPAAKPIVLLINEQSLSDAEMTAAGFKELGLGKIIGTETYRWIIFTSGKQLVDGSFFRIPAWGCYTFEGQNLELTGVAPDIHVENTFMDRVENKDPQLERAVSEILQQL